MTRHKTRKQMSQAYEVADIYEYMVECHVNGNHTQVRDLYLEMTRKARQDFFMYLFDNANDYLHDIVTRLPHII